MSSASFGRRRRAPSGRRASRRRPRPPPATPRRCRTRPSGVFDEAPLRVARVDALGAVAEVEVGPGQRGPSPPRGWAHQLLGGARVGRRLEHDRGSRAQVAGRACGPRPRCRTRSGTPSRSGVGTVMTATSKPAQSSVRGRRHGSGRWRAAACRTVVGDVLDVRLAGVEPLDPGLVDVEADDRVARPRPPAWRRAARRSPGPSGPRAGQTLHP